MEIALVSPTSIRIKGKLASFVIDPVAGKTKIQAEASLLLQEKMTDVAIEGSRLTIAGAGEYEVGGVKITGVKNADTTAYYLSIDGITLLVGTADSLKGKETLRDADIVTLLADGLFDQSALATIASRATLFYGPHAEENVKALGKEVQAVGKYVTTKEKLPAEMEVILLSQ